MTRIDWEKARKRALSAARRDQAHGELPLKVVREKYPHLMKPTNETLPPRLTKQTKRKRSTRRRKH